MQKIKIDKIFVNTQNAQKQPYVDKNGNPYAIVKIKSKDLPKGEATKLCREKDPVLFWKDGDTRFVTIETTDGGYYNFFPVDKIDVVLERLDSLEETLREVTNILGKS